MATQTLKNKILAAKKNFKKAKEVAKSGGAGGNSNVDDGRYRAQITGAKGPVEAQNSGRLQAILNFEIKEGEYKGEKLTSFPNLENEIGLGILIRELQALNYEIEDFDDIEGVLEELNKDKPEVRISVKTKGEYQNVSIDKLIDADDASDDSADDGADSGDAGEDAAAEEDASAEDAAAEIAQGDTVSFKLKGKETNGEVVEVVDEELLRVKAEADGKTYKIAKDKVEKVVPEEPAADAEPEADEDASAEEDGEADAGAEGTIELEEGSRVIFTLKGKETEGSILEVVDEETVRVKADVDGKTYKLSTEKIQPAPKAEKKKAVRKLPGKGKK